MEKFLSFIKRTKTKIDDIDKIFSFDFRQTEYNGNPFVSNKNKTYIWIEHLKKKL